MAGDLPISETIRLAGAHGAEAAHAATPKLHQYGALEIALGSQQHAPILNQSALDETALLGLEAFQLRSESSYRAVKDSRKHEDLSWGGGHGAKSLDKAGEHQGATVARSPAPASPRLRGRIGIGVVLVSGQQVFALTQDERIKIIAEIQNGLSWLAAQSPAKDITFVHQIYPVTVNVADEPHGGSFEACEAPWRDAALRVLGYVPGLNGIASLTQKVRQEANSPFAYCAFFTKYSLYHFAYEMPVSTPYLVMNYANDGWGPDNIDRVFAHESCHVFGAPDEYADARCNCGGRWGPFGLPNSNCETCAPGGGVKCLMRANTWAMCGATPYHVGFNGLPPPAGRIAGA